MRSALVNILGSSAIAQLLIVAATPLLTRRFDQDDFGVLGVATTCALLLSTLLTCKLEHSLHTSSDPSGLYAACLTTTLVLGIGLGAVVGLALVPVLGAGRAALVVLFALSHANAVCGLMMLNRRERFRAMAATNLVVPATFLLGALVVPGPATGGTLLLWQALSWSAAALVALTALRGDVRLVPLADVRRALVGHRQDLCYLVPSHLLSITSLNLTVIGAAWLFDAAAAGLVVIAQRVARAPVTVVGNSLNEVLRASVPYPGRIRRTFVTVTAIGVAAGIALLVAVYAVPESAYELVLGSGWTGLKAVLFITAVAACFQLTGTSVASLLTAFDKGKDLAVNAALMMCGLLALGIAAAIDATPAGYLWAHTILVSMVYAAAYLLARRVSLRVSAP